MNPVTVLGNAVLLSAPDERTATVTGAAVRIHQYQGGLEITQVVGTVGGTSPTLDGKIQESEDIGVALATATYDHTGGAAERLITKASAFANYTYTAGDVIKITAATGGVEVGTYLVGSRESDNTITLAADPRLTADATGISSNAFADVSGATFTQVTASDAFESITISADSSEGYIRYVGTIAGTSPSFDMAAIGFGQQKRSAAQ